MAHSVVRPVTSGDDAIAADDDEDEETGARSALLAHQRTHEHPNNNHHTNAKHSRNRPDTDDDGPSHASRATRKTRARCPRPLTREAALLATILLLLLLLVKGPGILPHPAFGLLVPSSPSCPSPPSSALSPPRSPALVHRYELCPRGLDASSEANLSSTDVNHFLLPHGRFSFPSFNVSAEWVRIPPDRFDPVQLYVEVYVQELLWDLDKDELKLAVIGLGHGDTARKNLLFDWDKYGPALARTASDLTATSSLNPGVEMRVTHAEMVGALYWICFSLRWPLKGDLEPDHLVVDLRHPAMLSASSACEPQQAGGAGWCSPGEGGGVYLRVSTCRRSYTRVSISFCSSALHSGDLLPHLRSFLSYHALLGIQRFVVFDHGFYREALQPYVQSGLVEWRYWPLPNRDFSPSGADWSQTPIIGVCAALADATSEFVAFFDVDEWLTLPTHDLPDSDLQKAKPSHPVFHATQTAPIVPSDCLSAAPQPLTVDPDLSFDLSLYASSPSPLLRCQSPLSRFLSTYRAYVIAQRSAQVSAMSAALHSANESRSDAMVILHHQWTLTQWDNLDPSIFSIFVFNFAETAAELSARERDEAVAQAAHEARVRGANASFPVHFHAAPPQRFGRRLRKHRGDSKAIYRTPVRKGIWIHPINKHEEYVNPNLLRISHYGSIIATRWTAEEPEVRRRRTVARIGEAPLPTSAHLRCAVRCAGDCGGPRGHARDAGGPGPQQATAAHDAALMRGRR